LILVLYILKVNIFSANGALLTSILNQLNCTKLMKIMSTRKFSRCYNLILANSTIIILLHLFYLTLKLANFILFIKLLILLVIFPWIFANFKLDEREIFFKSSHEIMKLIQLLKFSFTFDARLVHLVSKNNMIKQTNAETTSKK
jgi:hypothetical protein